jgi:adenylate cyclase
VSRVAGLAEWLVARAAARPKLPALHDAYCRELKARGLPLWRSTVGVETLHPEISGLMLTWVSGRLRRSSAPRRGVESSPAYLNSPTFVVDETGKPFRRRLDGAMPDMPLLDELRAEGATDYAMFPLAFLDRDRTAVMSFATTASEGFNDTDIADLEVASALFSPYAERATLRRIAVDLLDTYLGHSAGEKVFDGRIVRGDLEAIEAAILFCDMRGFTRWSDVASREEVIETLNAWFECIADPVETGNGEILKFIGDGLLAIFPGAGNPGEACRRALAAACAAVANVARLNTTLARPIAFGLALHVGEVAFGNIGSRKRLDFTVIGPAVNHAARLQELTKTLQRTVLASGVFAACAGGGLVPLGRHALRDVAAAEDIYTIEG